MNRKLARLARLHGIQTSYIGLGNKRKDASPEALLSVLATMGTTIRGMDDVEKALAAKEKQLKVGLPPVIVAWEGKLDAATKRAVKHRPVLTNEQGVEEPWPPRALEPGYYRLNDSLIISSPRKAHFPFSDPVWGVFAPVYALHSHRNNVAGDLTDFRDMFFWMTELGGKVAGTLPLLANYLDEPFEPSPYSPASRLYWNELYADPEQTPEFANSAKAQRLRAQAPPRSKLLDYRQAMRHHRSVLEGLAETFFRAVDGRRREEFEAFLKANPTANDYARFRAVTDRQRVGWSRWPDHLRAGRIEPEDYDDKDWQYHIYAQWIVQEQLAQLSAETRAAGGALYLDLPLGLHPDSYDRWRYPDLFVKGVSGGAPPDIVFTTGQNWGLPPMHPDTMRQTRHEYTIAYIRNHLKYAALLRIDHVMGLHRFFWIPDGMPVSEGVYVEYPAEELYAIFCLESHRNHAGIVGENLGNVAPVVNASMRKHNIQQMFIVQYQLSDSAKATALGDPAPNAVASLNTHDMPPFRAFLDGTDIPDKLKLRFVDKEAAQKEQRLRARLKKSLSVFLKLKRPTADNILDGALEFLARSRARIVLVNMEDLWQETLPQNIPATSHERPNWRRRLRYGVQRIENDRKILRMLQRINNTRNKTKK